MDCSVPGSSVHGDSLGPRTLEWGAYPFSRRFPHSGIEPGSPALQMDSLPAEPPGKPHIAYTSIFKTYIEIIYGDSPKWPLLAAKNTLIPTLLQFHDSTLGWRPLTYLKWVSGARKGKVRGDRNGDSVTKAEDTQGNKTLLQRLRKGQLGNAPRFRIKNNTIILNHVHSARIIVRIGRLHFNVIWFLVPVSRIFYHSSNIQGKEAVKCNLIFFFI